MSHYCLVYAYVINMAFYLDDSLQTCWNLFYVFRPTVYFNSPKILCECRMGISLRVLSSSALYPLYWVEIFLHLGVMTNEIESFYRPLFR
jgi:long-subunit acyl-CoA synthetase (AMP-forming)